MRPIGKLLALFTVSLLAALLAPASGMAVGGGISGTVTAASGGAPLAGVEVCAIQTSPFFEFGPCDETDGSGKYTIGGLADGTYKVRFESPDVSYAPQYYDGVSTQFEATALTVKGGNTVTGVDAALEKTGSIAGLVTDAATDDPIAGIRVCAEEVSGLGFESCNESEADGTYAIVGLRPGKYRVSFRGILTETGPGIYAPLNYVTQYYDGESSSFNADLVAVAGGAATSGIDAAMVEGAEATGTVTEATTSDPLEGVEVCAHAAASGREVRCASTDSDGKYLLFGLPGGNYKFGFTPGFSQPTLARQYFDEQSSLASADVVPLSAGSQATGLDAALLEAGKVTGTVTKAAGGAPIEGLQVCAESGGPNFGCSSTDAGGHYTIVGLEAGEYTVRFAGGSDYLPQYYSGKASFNEADRIEVENGTTKAGVDAQMKAAGQIKGHVSAADTSGPLQGIEVCAVKSAVASFFPSGVCAQTGPDGSYTLGGLGGGSYDVRFTPGFGGGNYLSQYYSGAIARSEADPVAVSEGAATAGIDAALQPGAKISGTVVDAVTKEGLEETVCALPASGSSEAERCATSDEDGEYTIQGLRGGAYKVRFTPWVTTTSYLRQYYSGKATKKEADPVSVPGGGAIGGIDAELVRGGKITGTVTDAGTHAPIEGIDVCVGGRCDETAADGTYAVEGLPSGKFKLFFRAWKDSAKYVSLYYDGKVSETEAERVTVTAGQTTAGIDQELPEGARISGTVIDDTTKEPLTNMTVCVFSPSSSGAERCFGTEEDGSYEIEGLPAGSYRVRFAHNNIWPPENGRYMTQHYDDAASADDATLLPLDLGDEATGIDAEMHEGGRVEGLVTRASDGAPLASVGVCVIPQSGEWTEECAGTDYHGEYTLEGVPTGSYIVVFYPGWFSLFETPNLVRQYYDGAADQGSASLVSVTAGATTSGIDAELLAGAQISGTITAAADGKPLEGVSACAYEAGGEEELFECGSSNAHGEYTINRLPAGSFKLKFSALNYEWEEEFVEEGEEEPTIEEEFLTQYWSGKSSLAAADPLMVTTGQSLTGIDVQMVRPSVTPPPPPPSGGGSTPPAIAPPVTSPPPAKPKPRKCRKGYKRKLVHGKRRCVKVHKHRKHKRHR